MSTVDLVSLAQLILGIALLVGMVLLLRRPSPGVINLRELEVLTQGLRSDLERIERTIRDNDSRSFNSAEDRGKALRAEVSEAISRSATTLVTSLAAVGDAQKGQFESFAAALKSVGDDLKQSAARGTELQKSQLDSFARQLADGVKSLDERMEVLRQVIDKKITVLLDGIGSRFESAKEASAVAAKGLREEVQTTLKTVGDDLRQNAEISTNNQNDRLGEVSKKLVELRDGIGQRFEMFRQVTENKLTEMRQDAGIAAKQLREELMNTLNMVGEDLRENAKRLAEDQRMSLESMGKRMSEIGEVSQRSQEKLRETVAEGLTTLRRENEEKLEQMRHTVDEKLQGTLEKRLGESFTLVSQQLKQVHEGLGDMQKLATGVGDLKRVLTNVKSRGTWGETQLAAILEDMLGPDQYLRNVQTKDGSSETVEFCIKIPLLDEHQEHVLLPIDAKFPMEDYERLMAAADSGDPAGTEQAAQKLEARFRSCAKDISTKYVSPPRTTEYAVMYVPSEGLYAELIKRPGVLSAIAREFNVVIAGPTNLTAILNAVHAVSRSVTIQHKAGEIAALLLKVQSEFVKYGQVVTIAKRRAESTVKAMETLDTRQRAMGRALRGVKSIEGIATAGQLPAPTLDLSAIEAEEGGEDDIDDVDLSR